MPDDPQFTPESWSIEEPYDFGDFLDREPPTYEDDDAGGDDAAPAPDPD